MSVGISFTMCSFFFIALLNIVFFKKERFNTLENKIYSYLILTSLFGTIIGVPCYYFMKYKEIFGVFNIITSKLYLVYLVMWLMIFTMYILLITVKNINKSKLIKNIFAITTILLVGVIVLPLYYHNENGVVFSYGPSTNLMYIISGIFILIVIVCMLKNIRFLKQKKFIPITAFLIVGTVIMIIQKLNPGLLLLTFGEAFITFLMYFTIENPDVKQINELARNNEIVEQTYIDKSNFLFEMTGEVREPLNNIRKLCDLIMEEKNIDDIKMDVKSINNSIRQLDFVVNDVLNVSSLDVQKVKFLNNRYNLDMIYEDLIKRVESSISKNVEFRYNIPNNVPYLYGDNIKLKQVLYSIIMNSVKKTEKGFIEFNIDTIEKYDVCRVIFRIIDSGVGIGIDKINEILSTTSELNKDDIVNLQKSEFNIELCQKIIKSLGGNMLIKSKLGKGTEVILTIDQKIYREKEDNFNLFNNYSNKRVLVVNQDKKVNEVIKKVFNESDINASYILYGADAVDRIKSGKKYDYIIIEDDMKEMSGYETLKRLKEINKFNVPSIVILDSNKENIKKHYIEDGFSDYILTSDLRNELKRIIEKY